MVKLLVCGAGGMLGRDVVRAARAARHDVVALDRRALDITEAAAVGDAVGRARPAAVVNCAAYTDVDGAESEPEAALQVNREGARNVAAAAAGVGAAVLFPSTDYVFDGRAERPYVESDAPSPLGSYGRSKLAGELATAAENPRHHVIRTSWLFGTGGRNFVETMIELGRRRDELSVVSDQVGSPTYTAHLAERLLRLATVEDFGIRHMAADGHCSWYDFAVAIFERTGMPCRVTPTTTAEFGRPAPRPAYSVLASERADAVRLPAWQSGLDAYLAER